MSQTTQTIWSHYTIAFYNLENLFDTIDDPNKVDEDFTPKGFKHWNQKRLKKKVRNLGHVIQQIGFKETGFAPAIVGVAEVENKNALQELVGSKHLKDKGYSFIHFDSKDERGIDTALLYRPKYFKVLATKNHEMFFEDEKGDKDFTRDILQVKGILENQEITILVNHFPSRRAGVTISEPKRMLVATKNAEILRQIREEDPNAKIIVMGDFNDDPASKSIQHLASQGLYNPMELLLTQEEGSLTYKGDWNLFDQILLSENFLQQHGNDFRFKKANIFGSKSVQVLEGPYKGHPFRTFAGPKYLGGVSDHFPVYSTFKILKNQIS